MAVVRQCEVYVGQQPVGTLRMGRRGLYWAISCRCDAQQGRGNRLVASGEFGRIDLGLLYPIGDQFGLETTVRVSRLGEGNVRFLLEAKAEKECCIALDPNKPFAYLDRLEECRFCVRDGVACVILPNKK